MSAAYTLARAITQTDVTWWIPRDLAAGETVYRCTKPTYGAVQDFAATLDPDGGYPFFEVPYYAIVTGYALDQYAAAADRAEGER